MDDTNMNNSQELPLAEAGAQEQAQSKKYFMPVLLVLLVLSLAAAAYFYRQLSLLKKDPQKIAQQEIAVLVEKVGKLIVLPEGEQPTVATVTDPDKLKSQPFFTHAKTGDKILIYTNAKKAILYSQEANKIVEVAPLSIGTP